MPHDAKGHELKPGDIVVVPFKVKGVHLSENYCNLELETCATMPPEHISTTHFANINAQMVLRANAGDDTSFTVLHAGPSERRIVERTNSE